MDVIFDQGECLNNGLIEVVVTPKFADIKQVRESALIVRTVRGTHHQMHLAAKNGAFGFVLLDQILQQCFTCHRKHDIAHQPIRLFDGSIGNMIEDALLCGFI